MNWKEDWKTSLLGVLILAAVAYRYYQTGEINWAETVAILAGIGFIQTVDKKQ